MTWSAYSANLKQLSVEKRWAQLPSHLQEVLKLAQACHLQVREVWIFGSRSRGDARANSDFDLAFRIQDPVNWSSFVTQVQEDPPSLYKYDLVNLDQVDPGFHKAILDEGTLIYESGQ